MAWPLYYCCSVAKLYLTLWWTTAQQASLSFIFWSLHRFMCIEWMMLSNHLILSYPLLLFPSIFPSIRVFSIVCGSFLVSFTILCLKSILSKYPCFLGGYQFLEISFSIPSLSGYMCLKKIVFNLFACFRSLLLHMGSSLLHMGSS